MKNIYFLSDFHLGVPTYENSRERERYLCDFLNEIADKAEEIFLAGDIFDMWYEYKTVVPKGYVRLLGTLASLSDRGIKITAFTGNHDMWMFGYLKQELNIEVHREPIERTWNGINFLIGHGDGLGPGDYGYKFIKKIFANKLCQWLFGWIHPDWGLRLANALSRRSRIATGTTDATWLGDDKEHLYIYCQEYLQKRPINYFIFGHRHLPLTKAINPQSTYINLGDWVKYFTYAVFDGMACELKTYQPKQ